MLNPSTGREPEPYSGPRWSGLLLSLLGIGLNVSVAGKDSPIRLCWGAVRADEFGANGPSSTPPSHRDGGASRPAESKVDFPPGQTTRTDESDAVEPAAGQTVGVEIEADPGGAYRAKGRINDSEVVFLVDTGADRIAIPERLKDRLKLSRGVYAQRAVDGSTVGGYETRIERLELGPLRFEGVTGWLNPRTAEDVVLLGVSALEGVRFERGIGKLTLIPLRAAPLDSRSAGGRDGAPTFKRSLNECDASGRIIDRTILDCLEGR